MLFHRPHHLLLSPLALRLNQSVMKQETCRSIKLRELSACGRFVSHTKATERNCRMTAHGPSSTSQLHCFLLKLEYYQITQVKIYSSSYLTRPTLEHRWTLDRLRSIYPDMINHFASQSQTCQLLIFFKTLKWNCEKWCNLRSNWWAATLNMKFPFSDSFKYK